jgi:hypothetical protein
LATIASKKLFLRDLLKKAFLTSLKPEKLSQRRYLIWQVVLSNNGTPSLKKAQPDDKFIN